MTATPSKCIDSRSNGGSTDHLNRCPNYCRWWVFICIEDLEKRREWWHIDVGSFPASLLPKTVVCVDIVWWYEGQM